MAQRKAQEPTVDELVALSADGRVAKLNRKSNGWCEAYEANWANWVRADQKVPPGDWTIWLLLAGRGFGKTRVGAEWVRAVALGRPGARIALVAETPAEARSVMVEGASGLLNIGLPGERPEFDSSLKRLRWANGSIATLYGASDADSLRGCNVFIVTVPTPMRTTDVLPPLIGSFTGTELLGQLGNTFGKLTMGEPQAKAVGPPLDFRSRCSQSL